MNGTSFIGLIQNVALLLAMASHRLYCTALGIEAALEEIDKNKVILYVAAVANACLRLFREKSYNLS